MYVALGTFCFKVFVKGKFFSAIFIQKLEILDVLRMGGRKKTNVNPGKKRRRGLQKSRAALLYSRQLEALKERLLSVKMQQPPLLPKKLQGGEN